MGLFSFARGGKSKPQTSNESFSFQPSDTFAVGRLQDLGSYSTLDPNFNEEALREKLSNLYVQMQNAWTDDQFEVMRPYISQDLYGRFEENLNQLTSQGKINFVDRIAVLGVTFDGWYEEGGNDYICAQLRTRIVDYVTDGSGKVVSGSDTAECFMVYRWILQRDCEARGASLAGGGVSAVNCPHCSAVLNINSTAKCPYCGNVVVIDSNDWVIASIQVLDQTIAG